MHRRPEAGAASWNAIEIHQRDFAHALLEHRDARVDEFLTLFRGLVLRVLPKVAQLPGALDLLRQLELQLALERGDLLVETLEDPILHVGSDFNIALGFRIGDWRFMIPESRITNHESRMKTIASRQHP